MTLKPDTTDAIYTRLKNRLTDKVDVLTNFAPTSFNYLWLHDVFAAHLRELELAALAVQLSSWVDYAGKELTEDDLVALGIENVDPDELNRYMHDRHLDELAKMVGVSRDPGQRATGEVVINTTSDSVTVPEGTEFGTQPSADGTYLSFYTTEDAMPDDGSTSVTAPVEAANIGTEYNVGGGSGPSTASITYMPNPPNGVTSVYNPDATSGGKDRQSNSSLRRDIKNAVVESTEGGTTNGIAGYIEDNTNASEVVVNQYYSGDDDRDYPHAHVIVLGGSESNIQDAIDYAHPSAVEHVFDRPTSHDMNVDISVEGSNIDTGDVESAIREHFGELRLGDDVIRDQLIQITMNADDDSIHNIATLDLEVNDEAHTIGGEMVDDFEDADLTPKDDNWTGWTGDTGALTAQTTTVLTGSYTAELAASNATNTVSVTRDSAVTTPLKWRAELDTQTSNAGDSVGFKVQSDGTALGALEFHGDGSVVWNNGSSNTVTTWSVGTAYTPRLDFDFTNDQVTVAVGGSSGTFSLQNSASGYDAVAVTNDTTSSGSTVNAYFDTVQHIEPTYTAMKSDSMASDAITSVTDGSGTAYTEGTDFTEADTDNDGTSEGVKWLLGGTSPDVGEEFYLTYLIEEDMPIQSTEVSQLSNVTVMVV